MLTSLVAGKPCRGKLFYFPPTARYNLRLMFVFSRLQLDIEMLDEAAPTGFWGARLRGGYGTILKRGLCDHPALPRCQDCSRWTAQSCAYPTLFKPLRRPEQTIERPLGGDALPAPFVLEAPTVLSPLRRGERLRFGLVLIGEQMCDQFEYPVRALAAFGEEGVFVADGRRSKFKLVGVYDSLQSGVAIFEQGILAPPHRMQASEFVAAQAPLGSETEINFVTRTCIEQQNAPRRDPRNGQAIFETFYDVVLHLLNRIGGLQQLYGIGWSGQRDFLKQREILLRSAKAINRVSAPEDVRMEYEEHYSSSRHRYEPFDGFRGKLRFAGEMAPFAELLRLGEIVHVGQQTSYGLGQFTLSSGSK